MAATFSDIFPKSTGAWTLTTDGGAHRSLDLSESRLAVFNKWGLLGLLVVRVESHRVGPAQRQAPVREIEASLNNNTGRNACGTLRQ